MRVSIQQPYFFPYPGYFAMLARIDILVLLTDVQFQRRGWIHRNRIPNEQTETGWSYFRIPVSKAPRDETINCVKICQQQDWKTKLTNQLRNSYGEEGFTAAKPWGIEELISCQDEYLLPYLIATLKCTIDKLGMRNLEILDSSNLDNQEGLTGSDRILDLCELLGATQYWNLPGGKELYSKEQFAKRGISLNFVGESALTDKSILPWSVLHAICSGQESKLHNTIYK